MITAPIIIVDEDEDDHAIVKQISKELELNLPLLFFKSSEELLEYLQSRKQSPFLIISEVNLPKMQLPHCSCYASCQMVQQSVSGHLYCNRLYGAFYYGASFQPSTVGPTIFYCDHSCSPIPLCRILCGLICYARPKK